MSLTSWIAGRWGAFPLCFLPCLFPVGGTVGRKSLGHVPSPSPSVPWGVSPLLPVPPSGGFPSLAPWAGGHRLLQEGGVCGTCLHLPVHRGAHRPFPFPPWGSVASTAPWASSCGGVRCKCLKLPCASRKGPGALLLLPVGGIGKRRGRWGRKSVTRAINSLAVGDLCPLTVGGGGGVSVPGHGALCR